MEATDWLEGTGRVEHGHIREYGESAAWHKLMNMMQFKLIRLISVIMFDVYMGCWIGWERGIAWMIKYEQRIMDAKMHKTK